MKYFHISGSWLGGKVTLDPRVPESRSVGEDGTTPRICVAANVTRCLRGLTPFKTKPTMYVYQAIKPKSVDWDGPQKGVPDWEHSEEIWITKECEFVYVGIIQIWWTLDSATGYVHRKPMFYWRTRETPYQRRRSASKGYRMQSQSTLTS